MTPKEQYEARKAERKRKREELKGYREPDAEEAEIVEILDRFVTAVERIADVMERGSPQQPQVTLDLNGPQAT